MPEGGNSHLGAGATAVFAAAATSFIEGLNDDSAPEPHNWRRRCVTGCQHVHVAREASLTQVRPVGYVSTCASSSPYSGWWSSCERSGRLGDQPHVDEHSIPLYDDYCNVCESEYVATVVPPPHSPSCQLPLGASRALGITVLPLPHPAPKRHVRPPRATNSATSPLQSGHNIIIHQYTPTISRT